MRVSIDQSRDGYTRSINSTIESKISVSQNSIKKDANRIKLNKSLAKFEAFIGLIDLSRELTSIYVISFIINLCLVIIISIRTFNVTRTKL